MTAPRTKTGMPKRDRRQESRDLKTLREAVYTGERGTWLALVTRILSAHAGRLANLELRRDRKQERCRAGRPCRGR